MLLRKLEDGRKIGEQKVGELVSIFGSNFRAKKDKIWLNDKPIQTEEQDEKNFNWLSSGDRIDMRIN